MSLLKGMNPGRLNHRITIMRYQETIDDAGNTVNMLAPYKTVWAEIRPTRGTEQIEYYKVMDTQAYKVTIRCTDVTVKDALLFKGRQFLINSIANPLEDNYYLELLCTEDLDHEEPEVTDSHG